MMLLKSCPRCRKGDLIVDRDEGSPAISCLQCGFIGDLRMARPGVAAPVAVVQGPGH